MSALIILVDRCATCFYGGLAIKLLRFTEVIKIYSS